MGMDGRSEIINKGGFRMNIIDCKGLKCPQPVINTKKYFDSIEDGEAVVIVDNEVSKNNVVKFATSNGYKNSVKEENSLYHITINKEACEACGEMNFEEKLSILIGSNKFGEGDDTLGETLMKSYLFALSESDKLPTHIMLVNGGVKLGVESSDVLESLFKLKERGVEILSCGTCLDFYGLKEKLAIGEITNMYTIVEIMNKSTNTINL